jgi:excisionase family DNA binding protein
MDEPILLSIDKAAEKLGIGRSKTYELITQGRLLTVNIGRRRLVRIDSVRAVANGEVA